MWPQILGNGLVQGCLYALFAASLTLVYRTARFFDFSQAAWIAVGAYSAFWLGPKLHTQPYASLAVGAAGSALVAGFWDFAVYRRLRDRKAGALVLMLASLGVYTIAQNALSIAFGDDVKTLTGDALVTSGTYLGVRLAETQIRMVVACPLLVAALAILLERTRFGLSIRGLSVDPELARIDAIPAARLTLLCYVIASALGGVGGTLVAYDSGAVPTLGLNLLMMGVIATVISGGRSIGLSASVGLALGVAQSAFGWWLGGQWQDAMAFAMMAVVIVLFSIRAKPMTMLRGAS